MNIVFAYANTVSLEKEMLSIEVDKMNIGDVLIDARHFVIIVDMAENKATGGKKNLF